MYVILLQKEDEEKNMLSRKWLLLQDTTNTGTDGITCLVCLLVLLLLVFYCDKYNLRGFSIYISYSKIVFSDYVRNTIML